MKELPALLEALAASTVELAAVRRAVQNALARDPAAAPDIGAQIEASFTAGTIPAATRLDLLAVVRATAQVDVDPQDGKTRLRQPVPPAAVDEHTRLRPAGPATPPPVAPPPATDTGKAQRSGPTGASWGDPSQWAQAKALQVGDVVKERFVLEEILGQGGMGVVFKVRDLRKEEAQDRSPYAALKVLNEDFKRHPESLKALQREARKAQTLAHPNIVTVYDFDRDGSNVYVVMELLEGQPLDGYIRALAGHGLPIDKALPIVRALCNALAYAHQHNVVHSDFKPSNAFITHSGAVKVFDFGIARAAKLKPGADLAAGAPASDLTLFDAGTLGAFTPAYASCEMIDGLDPDPRDDVYALGCVVYELLTGAHPFQRMSAVQARDAQLVPAPVRGLKRQQWRALRRALAFARDSRSAGVEAFLREFSPQRRSAAPWIGAAAVLAVTAIAALLTVPGYLQTRRVAALAVRVTGAEAAAIRQALPELRALPDDTRDRLLRDDGVRTALFGLFGSAIDAAVDASRQRYDYPEAERQLAELQGLYPDSKNAAEIGAALQTRKSDEIKRQSDRLDDYLRRGWLVAEQNADNVAGVLARVRQVDPQHGLLADPRLPSVYAEQIQLALARANLPLAQALARDGLATAPGNQRLQDLNDRVGRAMVARERATRLAELRQRLGGNLPDTATLAQLDADRDALLQLLEAAPQDAGLRRVQARLQQLLDKEIVALVAAGTPDQGQALLARYAALASAEFVARQRGALAGRYTPTGTASATRDAAVAGLRQELDALLSATEADPERDAAIRAGFARLSAYLAPEDTYLTDANRRTANAYLTAARTLREQGRLSETERLLQLAQRYAPDLPQLDTERRQLAEQRATQAAGEQERRRVAELDARKQKFRDQLSASELDEASESLRVLRTGLPAQDEFLRSAPRTLADAHVRKADADALQNRFDSADRQLARALELDPGNANAVAARARLAEARRGTPATPPATPATAPAVATLSPATPASTPPTQVVPDAPLATAPAATPPTAARTQSGQCSSDKAGYGSSASRGVCFDPVPGGRGPQLVVIPAGGGIDKPFAITRTEVSMTDYAQYCQQSGRCRVSAGSLPLTGIAVSEAEQYAQWLSTHAGFTYRLPTEAEWLQAASAPNSKGTQDANCTLTGIDGRKIRGLALLAVSEGQPNDWGLLNLFGNAREWVRTAAGWSTRGGAYTDPNTDCDARHSRASNGAADTTTGFRLVREIP